jgi:hypothetical protein
VYILHYSFDGSELSLTYEMYCTCVVAVEQDNTAAVVAGKKENRWISSFQTMFLLGSDTAQ